MNKNLTDDNDDFALANALDATILMHRDAHFGGNFAFMLEYYEKEGKGVHPEIELSRILELQQMENQLKQNLAAVILTAPEAERVADAKTAYKKLRDLYEIKRAKTVKVTNPLLIADLILSEEEEPEAEIAAAVAEKGEIVPQLISLLRSEDFYDPLFPGYGQAPFLASKCLGLIGDKRAIIALFELIGEEDFFSETQLLEALKQIGDPAKEFLLKVLHSRPINLDNERAAIALAYFKDDPEVAATCFKMLTELDLNAQPIFATYLVLACEGLNVTEREAFIALMDAPKTPKMLKQDMQIIAKQWK
jgi:HEAT repeat protein